MGYSSLLQEATNLFKYIRLNSSQEELCILTQKDYINSKTEMKLDKKEKTAYLSDDEKSALRAKIGQLLWISK